MENKERDFKGIWIPKEIWLSKELTTIEKLFIVEINSLDNSEGCFASNKYFADFFGISKGRCTQIIKSLESKGFVTIEIERDGKIISKRVVRILNTLVNKLNTLPSKTKYPYLENDEDNNTVTNNTNIKECVEEFWTSYPVKQGGKQKTEKLYNKLYKEHDAIMLGLQRHIKYWSRRGKTTEFIPNTPHATTFLNQRRWEDELEIKEEKKQSYNPL